MKFDSRISRETQQTVKTIWTPVACEWESQDLFIYNFTPGSSRESQIILYLCVHVSE
jgi:hypothetical protein